MPDAQPSWLATLSPRWRQRGLIYAWNFANASNNVGDVIAPSGAVLRPGPGGLGLATPANTSAAVITLLANSIRMPLNGCTVIYAASRVATDATADQRAAFTVGAPASTSAELHAYVPFNDGNVYWRYGNGTGISVAQTVAVGQMNVWGFVAGTAAGRQIWRNGVRVAADATNIQRTVSTSPFVVGTATGGVSQPMHNRYALLVFNQALLPQEMQFLGTGGRR